MQVYIFSFVILHLIFATVSCTAKPLIKSYEITKTKLVVQADQEFTDNYLTNDFFVEYLPDTPDFDLRTIDLSIALMPFIMTVMPIVWASGGEYSIDAMDENLVKALEEIRKVFQFFYPGNPWKGKIIPKRLVNNSYEPINELAVAYSGGLDCTYASFKYLETKQHLFLIKSVKCISGNSDKDAFWESSTDLIQNYANRHTFGFSSAKCNWKKFFKKQVLHHVCENIPRMWWGYTTQGLGYAGLAAPLMVHKKLPSIIIGATHTKAFMHPWGTHPLVDNKIRFANAHVLHIGYEATRHQKLEFIEEQCAAKKIKRPTLRVCNHFGYGQNRNCGFCEKCLRTSISFIALGIDPLAYGLNLQSDRAMKTIQHFFRQKNRLTNGETYHWKGAQEIMQQRLSTGSLHDAQTCNFFNWFLTIDLQRFNKQKRSSIKKIDWDNYCYR